MAIVPANQQRDVARALAIAGVNVRQLVDLASKVKALHLPSRTVDMTETLNRRRKRKNIQNKDRVQNQRSSNSTRDVGGSIPRGLAGNQSMRTTLRDLFSINNSGTGISSIVFSLGSATTTIGYLGLFNNSYMPRFNAFCAMFRQFQLNTIKFEFVPYISSTNAGSVSIGIDPDPSATAPTTLAAPLRHKSSCLSDLQTKCSIVYNPLQDRKKDPRYTVGVTGRDDDEGSYGLLEIYSQNSLATAQSIGYLVFTVDVTFLGPT